jgi:hypothetical protein
MKLRDEVARRDGSEIYKSKTGFVFRMEKWRDGRNMVAVWDGSAVVWHHQPALKVVRRAIGEGMAIRWADVS